MKQRIIFLLLILPFLYGFNSTAFLAAQVVDKDEKILELQKEIESLKSKLEKLKEESNSIKELQERVDLLETRLEKFKIEIQEINPLITDAAKDWGKGFYLGSKLDNNTSVLSAEAGYNFDMHKKNTKKVPWINRVGFVIGFMSNELNSGEENNTIKIFPFHAVYTKISLNTPIFVNFISLSLNQKFTYKYSSGNTWYTGAGIDINFWIHRRTCITLGFISEPRIFKNDNTNEKSDDLLGKNQLGIRWFFK